MTHTFILHYSYLFCSLLLFTYFFYKAAEVKLQKKETNSLTTGLVCPIPPSRPHHHHHHQCSENYMISILLATLEHFKMEMGGALGASR